MITYPHLGAFKHYDHPLCPVAALGMTPVGAESGNGEKLFPLIEKCKFCL